MKWHEQHRARMAARTLARHRKATERALIRSTTVAMALQMGRPDLAAKLEGVGG